MSRLNSSQSLVATIPDVCQGIRSPRGFTILECSVALVMLGMAMGFILHIGYWSLRERERTGARTVAIEQATNIMETARATPWSELTAEWAANQRIAESMAPRLPDGEMTVTVATVPDEPRLKQISVEISWIQLERIRARPVRLVADFANRVAKEKTQ